LPKSIHGVSFPNALPLKNRLLYPAVKSYLNAEAIGFDIKIKPDDEHKTVYVSLKTHFTQYPKETHNA